jgi:hypothetical protein
VCPEWVKVYEQSVLKADFEYAVGMKTDWEWAAEWLDHLEKGGDSNLLWSVSNSNFG